MKHNHFLFIEKLMNMVRLGKVDGQAFERYWNNEKYIPLCTQINVKRSRKSHFGSQGILCASLFYNWIHIFHFVFVWCWKIDLNRPHEPRGQGAKWIWILIHTHTHTHKCYLTFIINRCLMYGVPTFIYMMTTMTTSRPYDTVLIGER